VPQTLAFKVLSAFLFTRSIEAFQFLIICVCSLIQYIWPYGIWIKYLQANAAGVFIRTCHFSPLFLWMYEVSFPLVSYLLHPTKTSATFG